MKTTTILPKSALAIALCAAAALLLSLGIARPAAAWYDTGWGYDYGGYDWNYGESQAWAEEQSREAGRSKRRDEIEVKKEKESAEHEAYYAAIVDASKASLNAPKGVYYRKPGFTSSEAPAPTAQSVMAGQVPLIYDQGIYWLARGADYIVVVPPFGVVVDTLPTGVRAQPTKEGMLYYFFGTYYKAKDGKYEVVKPPAGAFAGYLPDGYTQETLKDETIYKFGQTSFRQVYLQGALVYQVI